MVNDLVYISISMQYPHRLGGSKSQNILTQSNYHLRISMYIILNIKHMTYNSIANNLE